MAALTGTIIAGLAFATSVQQGMQARKEGKKARRLQERRGRLEASRSAVEGLRKAQIARSQIIQAGENQGVGGSSAVSGGISSVQSSTAGNIGFAERLFQLSQQAGARLQQAASFGASSQAFGQVSSFAANTDLRLAFGGVTAGTSAKIAAHDFS